MPESVGESTMKEIKMAKEELNKISQDKKERRLAELREKAIMDEMAIRDSGYNDGKKEGIKEGIEQGIEKGKNEGLKIGKKIRSIEIAKEMLKENLDLAVISKVTGLSSDELKNIK